MNVLFFGLGRIGLPQSLVFADAGHFVFGYDADPKVVDDLLALQLPFEEHGMEELLVKHVGRNFRPIHRWDQVIEDVDAVLFTLGTTAPDAKTCLEETEGDITPIEEIVDKIFLHPKTKKGILLVFRTTLFLGSTDRIKTFIEQKFDKKEGGDFFLSFVPERLVEGQAISEEKQLPKILSAYSDVGMEKVSKLFATVGGRQIKVSSPRTAEFCKLTDNSYRNTMFAFANELAMWASRRGVDVLEVINAVNADYDRNNIPRPGFVSGYCLGKDPYIFEYGFDVKRFERNFQSLWYYGRRINDHLVRYAIARILGGLAKSGKTPSQSKVIVLGLAFKEDVDDFRMSHSFDLINGLAEAEIGQLVGFDPLLNRNKYTRVPEIRDASRYKWSDTLDLALFSEADAILVAHRHKILREQNTQTLARLLASARRPLYIFDGWNIWRDAMNLEGVMYEALGYSND